LILLPLLWRFSNATNQLPFFYSDWTVDQRFGKAGQDDNQPGSQARLHPLPALQFLGTAFSSSDPSP